MFYEITRDGSYFRVLFDGTYEDTDPLYLTKAEAQKAIVRYQMADLSTEQQWIDAEHYASFDQ